MWPFSLKVAVARIAGYRSPDPVSSRMLFLYSPMVISAMLAMVLSGSLSRSLSSSVSIA